MPARRVRPKSDPLIPRQRLLDEFGMITLEELATLINVDVRTLRNRAESKLPPYTKVGAKRLFFKQDVIDWLRKSMRGTTGVHAVVGDKPLERPRS